MKSIVLILAMFFAICLPSNAQNADKIFTGRIFNSEYHVYIVMDFYKNNVTVPGCDMYGEMSGYFGDDYDSRKWLFTSAKLTSPYVADLAITNDYGSEDLTATLTYNPADTTYTLRQMDGSALKIARNRKWVKMPHELKFKLPRR